MVTDFVPASDLYVRMRCPRCGAVVKGKRGSPLYCRRCGALLDMDGHLIMVIHEVEGF